VQGGVPEVVKICEGWDNYTVIDANGCSTTASVEIILVPCNTQLTLLDSIMCFGDNNARIRVDVTGAASGPYTYVLYSTPFSPINSIGPTLADSAIFVSLLPATYFAIVYDSSYGAYCSTDTLVVTEPPPLASYVSIDSASNPWTSDGNLVIDSVTGGTPSYTYQWFDAFNNLISINPFVNNVSSGWYQLFVTDTNGCIDIGNYYIPVGISCDSLGIDTIQVNDVLCNGDSTGSAIVFIDSIGVYSMPPFTYVWLNSLNDTIRIDNNMMGNGFYGSLPAGNYAVSITDANGCVIDMGFEIKQYPQIIFDLGPDTIIPCGDSILLSSGTINGGGSIIDPSLFGTYTMFIDSVTDTSAFIITTDTTANNINYLLVVSGTYMHDDSTFYNLDAAYDYSDTTQIMHWGWNGATNIRPNPDIYSPIHTYTYHFSGTCLPQTFTFTSSSYSGVPS
jgi:hypothetical protein